MEFPAIGSPTASGCSWMLTGTAAILSWAIKVISKPISEAAKNSSDGFIQMKRLPKISDFHWFGKSGWPQRNKFCMVIFGVIW
jgi:hypothetical protein